MHSQPSITYYGWKLLKSFPNYNGVKKCWSPYRELCIHFWDFYKNFLKSCLCSFAWYFIVFNINFFRISQVSLPNFDCCGSGFQSSNWIASFFSPKIFCSIVLSCFILCCVVPSESLRVWFFCHEYWHWIYSSNFYYSGVKSARLNLERLRAHMKILDIFKVEADEHLGFFFWSVKLIRVISGECLWAAIYLHHVAQVLFLMIVFNY